MDSDLSNLQALTIRIAKLEKQNHHCKLLTGFLGILSVSLFLTAAKPADRFEPPLVRAHTIEAQDFILKDENGEVYARLRLKQDRKSTSIFGHSSPATLEFYDSNGDLAVTVPNSPGIVPVK
jgi:hypothetical protein